MSNDKIDPAKVAQEVIDSDENQRHALRVLLDAQGRKEGHLLACRSEMGSTVSYVTSVTLEWVANKIGFAGDLPMFEGRVDPDSKKIPVDEMTIGHVQQRSPDWRRQIAMTVYLAMREHHKFPPLLVVAYQPWVYDKNSDQWNADIAIKDSINADPLSHNGLYFDLDCDGTQYYALDGQHRLMAILGLRDLVKNKHIRAKKEDGSIRKLEVSIDALREEFGRMNKEEHATVAVFQAILAERIGIEIIPAVRQGETYRKALFRLRSIFVDVNETAKKVTKSETHQLDEEEGFRIVARNVAVSNSLLMKKTDLESMQLAETSENYTTLDAVVRVAEKYLGQLGEFQKWKNPLLGVKDFGFIRPDDEELRNAAQELDCYFSALSKLPSHQRFINGLPAGTIRSALKSDKPETKDNEDNVLFRPIAQMALAHALGILVVEKEMNLDDIIKTMSRQEDNGQLKLTDRKSPWFGVLCEPYDSHRVRRQKKYQDLAASLFIYLLGGGYNNKDEQESLRESLWHARLVEEKAYDFNGKKVAYETFHLPSPWQ